jgi:hypothetical protein
VATSVMLALAAPLAAAIACENFCPMLASCAQFFVDANDRALPPPLELVVVVLIVLVVESPFPPELVVAEVVVVVLPEPPVVDADFLLPQPAAATASTSASAIA